MIFGIKMFITSSISQSTVFLGIAQWLNSIIKLSFSVHFKSTSYYISLLYDVSALQCVTLVTWLLLTDFCF